MTIKAFQMNYTEPVIAVRILENYLQRGEIFHKVSGSLTQNKLLNIYFPRTLTTETATVQNKFFSEHITS